MTDDLRFEPQGFLLARTPALPFERFLAWTESRADRDALAAMWAEIGDAIYFASPATWETLQAAVAKGQLDERMEDTVARYVSRAATRTTPFGLFAGISAGRTGDRTALRFDGRRAVTALDFGWAAAMHIARNAIDDATICTTNPTLQETETQLQFVECSATGSEVGYALSALPGEPLVLELCDRAAEGCPFGELAAQASGAAGVDLDAARDFVRTLIDYGVLLTGHWPPLIGAHFRSGALRELDEQRAPLDVYRDLEQQLRAEVPLSDPGPVFHSILVRSGQNVVLGANVVAEVSRAVTLLGKIGRGREDRLLLAFARAFTERYGDREVPLLEALDEERGIGYDESVLPDTNAAAPHDDPERHAALLELIHRATSTGSIEVALTPEDEEALKTSLTLPLPPTFNVVFTLAAASDEAANAGAFRIHPTGIVGPPGTRMMSRFWYADPEVERGIAADAAAEQESDPDAVFAELVYQPSKGLEGNLLVRPRVRSHEILISGTPSGGAEPIYLRDLLVQVSGPSVLLRSRRDGRVVHPRVTSAHNFARPDILSIHRFLASLQWHGVRTGVAWNWDKLDEAPFTPRVTSGRTVLALAQWTVRGPELRAFRGSADAARAVIARWRGQGMPRFVVADSLTIDLDSGRSIRALQRIARRGAVLGLREYFPAPEAIPARDAAGSVVAQIDLPFRRVDARAPEKRRAAAVVPERVTFPPGSEWLYAKLYARGEGGDALLLEAVEPAVARAVEEGWIDSWFFIRYGDPLPHLRVRFHGDPAVLLGRVLPLLNGNLEPFTRSGRCARMSLDTYEPEISRYGGVEGVACAERLFAADSDAVLRLIAAEECRTDEGRRGVAILGVDRLLQDFGLSLAERRAMAEAMYSSSASAAQTADAKKELAQRFRVERGSLLELLRGGGSGDVAAVFDARHEALEPVVRRLHDLESGGALSRPVRQMLPAYCHMFLNRLFHKDALPAEAMAYDFLARLCTTRLATDRES
ncbi:MAG TPA: lantibiotic dehydratase [Thermoanaerobaculia bacterium]|nr:lantibiotic dehydratase [Thermoanaerobaculia bacterium]